MSQVTTRLKDVFIYSLFRFSFCWVSLQWISVVMSLARLCFLGRCSEERGERHHAGTKCPTTAFGLCHQSFPKKQMQRLDQPGKARYYVFLAKCLCAMLSAGTQEHFLASEVRYALTLCPDSWTSAQQHHIGMRLPGSLR